MTVRIPRTGQIRLSGHISASFNQNSGSQTSMSNNAVTAACHNTSTWSPTQRSMDSAHGVVTALTLADRYTNTNYGTSYYSWAANATTFDSIYNKQDTRADGVLYSSSSLRAPSVETYGTHGHTLSARVYDGIGAIYCQMNKKLGSSSTFNAQYQVSNSGGTWTDFRDTTGDIYVYGYPSGYLSGSRTTYLDTGLVIGTSSTETQTVNISSINPSSYPSIVMGYRGIVEYPGYGSRIGTLKIRPHYVRLVATSGYA